MADTASGGGASATPPPARQLPQTLYEIARARLWWRRALPWLLVATALAAFVAALVAGEAGGAGGARHVSALCGAGAALSALCFALFLPLAVPYSKAVTWRAWVGVGGMLAASGTLFAAAGMEGGGTARAAVAGVGAALSAGSAALLTTSLGGARDSAWEVARAFVSRSGPAEAYDERILEAVERHREPLFVFASEAKRGVLDDLLRHTQQESRNLGGRGELAGLYHVLARLHEYERSEAARAAEEGTEEGYDFQTQALQLPDAEVDDFVAKAYARGRLRDADAELAALRAAVVAKGGGDLFELVPPRRRVREDARRAALQPWI